MKVLPRLLALAFALGLPAIAIPASGFDRVARSNYAIVQEDETVPPAPKVEVEPSPSDLPAAETPAVEKPAAEQPPAPAAEAPAAPEAPAVPAPSAPSVADLVKDSGKDCSYDACDKCGMTACCCLGEPWKLPQPCLLQNMGINIGGWLQHGITYNAERPASDYNGPVATNDLDSEYQMNQLWLFVMRPVNTGGCGWDIGGRVDILLGTDFRFGINHGLEDRINGFDQNYGTVIPQAYVEVAYNDLSVKLGHFAAILDYEMIPAPPNPFYSHSYSYGYTVPQLVTGALADWKLTDQLSIQGGIHRGWMLFEDYNDDWDVMAGIKWASCDNKTSLAYAVSTGRQSFQPVLPIDDDNRFVYSLVAQRQLTERLRYVLVHNLGYEKESFTGADAEWYGLNNYFLYKINPCLSANLRAEWLRDDDGVRIAGPGNIPGIRAWDGVGYAGDFYEVTAGLNWRPHANIMFRPEVRYDWYDGPDSFILGNQPFDDGNSDHQLTLAVDMVITY